MDSGFSLTKELALLVSDVLTEGVAFLDGKGKALFLNKAARRIFQTAGSSDEKRDRAVAAFLENAGIEPGKELVKEFVLESPRRRCVFVVKAVPVEHQGSEVKTILAVRDVTDERRAGEEASAFVADVVHEFRTPLAIMRGGLTNVLDGVAGKLNAKQKDQLDLCLHAARRLSIMVADILDVSRIESGRMELSRENFDITGLINETIEQNREKAEKKGLKVETDIPEKLMVWGDREKLSKVVNNLFLHSIIETPASGRISVGVRRTDGAVRVEIRDGGKALDTAEKEKIFDKVRGFIKRAEAGLGGLALPVSKQIVELHKGKIWIENTGKPGNTFIFDIPMDLRAAERGKEA